MSNRRILLVEDNARTRGVVCAVLARAGHLVVEATSGTEALALADQRQPELMLVDLVLPDCDGFSLVSELRRRQASPDSTIVALAGYLSKPEEQRLVALGVDALIRKPIETSHLSAVVEAHLPPVVRAEERFGAGRRVVVAEDDPLQLKLLRWCLVRHGFEMCAAHDGQQALELARQVKPDVLIADVMMPRLDGFELAVALRLDPELREVPLLLVSSRYIEPSDRDLALRAGATDLIARSPDLGELVAALRFTVGAVPPVVRPAVVPELELERERGRRVIKQLERQVQLNSGLAHRCSALAAERAVLAKISEAMLRQRSIEAALDEVLETCFDACGVSQGALYLWSYGQHVAVRSIGNGEPTEEKRRFFGRLELLRRCMSGGRALHIPSPDVEDGDVEVLLHGFRATSLLLLPLCYLERPLGSLLMVGRGRDLADAEMQGFAQAICNQIAQVLSLAGAFAERERAEQLARERAGFLDALLEQAPDSILYLDPDGIVRYASNAVRQTHVSEPVGDCWFDLPSGDTAEHRRPRLATVISSGEPLSWESSQRGVDGVERTWWNKMAPIRRDQSIAGAILLARDITEKKEADARLIAADRMASVGTLAAGVAHEINNPLASVIANLDLALLGLRHLDVQAEARRELADGLRDARHAADRIRLIVRDLKVFSRAEEEKLGPVDLERLLDSTLRMSWNELRHRARLVKDYGNVPPVQGVESRLGQVFLNLLINAAHAIPEGNYEGNTIRVSTREDGHGRVVVGVADTGTGMTPEVKARLFSPFFTTKPVGQGTGLGLSICQRIVASLGGEIRYDSEPGRGTEFQVALPLARFEPTADVSESPPVTARRRGRVLVIDDEPTICRAVRRLLQPLHEVTTVEGALPALELLRGGQRFDVILCDLMMPQVTGMELFSELRALDAEQAERVVFVTGGAFTPWARQFLDSVSNQRVEKPFDSQGLRALVNEMIR